MSKILEGKTPDGDSFTLYQLRVLEDNYTYLLAQNGVCISIDPGDSAPVSTFIEAGGYSLDGILITHFHDDHIRGVQGLKEQAGRKVPVLGPKHKNLPFLDQCIAEGDEISLGPFSMQVIHAPGHTMEHVMYFFPELKLLFCGDVLFLGGCGKMFEGNEYDYFNTFEKIKKLPGDTIILTGHDYNKRNIDFIKHVDSSFSEEDMRETDAYHCLKHELTINPFLKAKSPSAFLEMYQSRDDYKDSVSTSANE